MCGIAGIWNKRGAVVDARALDGMLRRIVHRGPDDSGTWAEREVALGQVRLSILDLTPHGHQPMLTPDGQGVLVYNGEVYNYPGLRRELERAGVCFSGTSDTEVVLHALHTWGPGQAIPRFNGMFGLAYLDRRSRTLWLARDRLGIKPVHVASAGDLLVFGSEFKAVFAHPGVSARPDFHALTNHLLLSRFDGARTPFKGVETVEPGQYWRIQGGDVHRVAYYRVVDALDVDRLRDEGRRTPQDTIGQLDRLLASSVGMHLASDAPLATMCSGGVDSSLVTSYAKDGGGRFPSYVADVEGTVSEGAKALRVGQHIGVEVRPVCVSTADMVADWALATWHSEMPDVHPNSIPMLAVAKACQRDGIKVILTGEGADELFGGYSWYHDTYRMWRRRCRVSHLFAPLRMKGGWRLARALPWLGRIDQAARRGPVFAGMADTMSNGFGRRLMCAADPTRYVRPWALMKRLEGVAPRPQAAFLAQCLDDLHGHLQSLLLRNDRMCMAASVESRVPYIENALIDFALHLPFRAKRHAGQGKWLLKEVAATRLPRDIVYAPKIGFAFSARTYLSARPLIAAGIVPELFHWDHETTTAILDALGQDCSMMFHLGSLELWGRLFLRGESVDRVSELLVAAR